MIKNIIANVIGRFWSIIATFIFVPFYIKILGFESYSIISFTLIISSLMTVLDAGLTATLSREFSRKDTEKIDKIRTFFTLESVYILMIGISIGGVIFFADFISINWLKLNSLSQNDVSFFLKIISFDVGFQLLMRFYVGGFIGLDFQVKANIFQIIWALFRSGFVIFIIELYPRLDVFFIWQSISTVIATFFICQRLKLDFLGKFSFSFTIDLEVVKKCWRFSFGMMLIALVAGLNTQMDKLIISKLLPINVLGYYTLAASISMGLIAIISPVSNSLLPRFTSLYSLNKKQEATDLFQKVNLFVSIVVFSIMVNMIFFSHELIWIWTGNLEISRNSSIFLPYLSFSFAMLAMAMIPYNLAIANGYTRLNNILGLLSLIITIPGYWLGTQNFGPIGAAIVYSLVQFLITIIYIYFISKKFLVNISIKQIYYTQFFKPFLIALLTALSLSILPFYFNDSRLYSFLWFAFCICFTIFIVFLVVFGVKEVLQIFKYPFKSKI